MSQAYDTPIISLDIARSVDAINKSFVRSYFESLGEHTDSLLRPSIREIESVLATRVEGLPNPGWMNSIYGIDPENVELLDDLLEPYPAAVPCRIETPPYCLDEFVANALMERGFVPSESHAVLYGGKSDGEAIRLESLAVDRLSEEEVELFARIYLLGYGDSLGLLPKAVELVRDWRVRPGWKLYLGRVNGKAAGVAMLYIADGIGYLARAATDPGARGAGIQSALIRRRMSDAFANGCSIVSGQADFASTSHRNMQRTGLQLCYNKLVWTKQPRGKAPAG